jgi:hypothetical protein
VLLVQTAVRDQEFLQRCCELYKLKRLARPLTALAHLDKFQHEATSEALAKLRILLSS